MPVLCAIVHRRHLFVCCVKVLVDSYYSWRFEKALVLYKHTLLAWKICHLNHHLQALESRAEHWATERQWRTHPSLQEWCHRYTSSSMMDAGDLCSVQPVHNGNISGHCVL